MNAAQFDQKVKELRAQIRLGEMSALEARDKVRDLYRARREWAVVQVWDKHVTVAELADQLGVTRKTVYDWLKVEQARQAHRDDRTGRWSTRPRKSTGSPDEPLDGEGQEG